MARETIVLLTDDLDGSGADTTIQFGWNGVSYEIDLSKANADAFAAALQPYLAAARRVSGHRSRRTTSAPERTTGARGLAAAAKLPAAAARKAPMRAAAPESKGRVRTSAIRAAKMPEKKAAARRRRSKQTP